MVIDLPSSSQIVARGNQNPVTQVVNQRLETLLAALKALNIQPGETLTALVKAVHPVNETLRARLVQQATPPTPGASASASRNATAPAPTPGITAEPVLDEGHSPAATPAKTTHPELPKLLQSATLKLVEIEVQGKSLLTFTDRALRPDQTLTLQLRNNQLTILADKSAPPAYQTHLSATLTVATAERPSPLPAQARPPLSSARLDTLQQALRAQLPAQAETTAISASAISTSLHLAQLVTRLVRQPGAESLQQQIPRSVQESLQQLAAHLRGPQQLTNSTSVKQAIAGSGLQLENQLQQSAGGPSTGRLPLLPQTDVKAALLQALQQLNQSTRPGPTTASAAAHPSALAGAASSAAGTAPGPTGTTATSALSLIPVLQQLIQGSIAQRRTAISKLSTEKLLQATRQQVQQALDKLQYLQLQTLQKQSLQHARPHQEGLNTLHLQLEIPVSWGYGAHSIALSIDEDWVTDYTAATDKRKEKVQQWQVKMSFELPEAGTLHAHLTVIREQLSVSLWAESADTFAKTRDSLLSLRRELEKEGCEVKQLECFHGRPVAEDPMRLNCSLIDIQT